MGAEMGDGVWVVQLKALRESLADDEARAQSVLHERDAVRLGRSSGIAHVLRRLTRRLRCSVVQEILRLRRQLEELQSHHILPPLAFRYEPSTPPSTLCAWLRCA